MNPNNTSSFFPLCNFTKSPISENWMMGVTNYAHTKDYCTGKNIPRNQTFFWLADPLNRRNGKAIAFETYLTAIRNKKRCAEYIKKFEELGLPLDISFGQNEFKSYRLG